jgi:hypothetical protein
VLAAGTIGVVQVAALPEELEPLDEDELEDELVIPDEELEEELLVFPELDEDELLEVEFELAADEALLVEELAVMAPLLDAFGELLDPQPVSQKHANKSTASVRYFAPL